MTSPNSHQPLVSICVPTYNGGKFLRECLSSICAQTLADFEVIIVDDHSTDDSLLIAEEFARSDKRFRVQRNAQTLGLVANWNRCLELSRGTWIKILFQDDLIEPDCVAELVAACENSRCQFGFCRRDFRFEEPVAAATRDYFLKHQAMISDNFDGHMDAGSFAQFCASAPDMNPVGEPTVTLFHRSVFEKFGGFNPLFIQLCDAEYWMRTGSNVGVCHVPKRLATFRIHGHSATTENYARRNYHAAVLDPLIIRYLFLRDRNFKNIRQKLLSQTGRFSLWWRFIQHAYHAWQLARSRLDAMPGAILEMNEWNEAARALPGLQGLAYAGLLVVPLQNFISSSGLAGFLNKHRGRH